MELIRTQTFPITRQRISAALRLIPQQPDILSSAARMREARIHFICGTNVRQSIRGWLMAAGVISSEGRSYKLTEFGERLAKNDISMAHSSSWWCFHLNICFSSRSEPYRSFVAEMGRQTAWVPANSIAQSVAKCIENKTGQAFADATIENDLEGIIKIFTGASPLTDIGLIETRKEAGKQLFRLGTPEVTDETLVYALSLARERHFRNAATLHFKELTSVDFHHFIGMSVSRLQRRLREMSRNRKWEEHFKFVEGKDLESIEPRSSLWPRLAVLPLLQETTDTWI